MKIDSKVKIRVAQKNCQLNRSVFRWTVRSSNSKLSRRKLTLWWTRTAQQRSLSGLTSCVISSLLPSELDVFKRKRKSRKGSGHRQVYWKERTTRRLFSWLEIKTKAELSHPCIDRRLPLVLVVSEDPWSRWKSPEEAANSVWVSRTFSIIGQLKSSQMSSWSLRIISCKSRRSKESMTCSMSWTRQEEIFSRWAKLRLKASKWGWAWKSSEPMTRLI